MTPPCTPLQFDTIAKRNVVTIVTLLHNAPEQIVDNYPTLGGAWQIKCNLKGN